MRTLNNTNNKKMVDTNYKKIERPNQKDYNFNDSIEGVRFAKDMINYADYTEKQVDNAYDKGFKDAMLKYRN